MKNRILLIEDDVMLAELTCEMISIIGYEAIHTDNMNDAIKLFTENKDELAIVIFDMNLDEVSGKEVYDKLVEIDDEFVSVLASGMAIEAEEQKYKKMGFQEVILKPYNMETLKKLIKKYIKE